MTAVLDNQVLSARLLSDGRIVTHTFHKVYLIRVRYPVSGEDYCECVEKTVLYEAGVSDYIRDICLRDGDHPCVIVAVNNNDNNNLAARVLKIKFFSDSEPETIAKFEPANENIRQYVIRSMHIENDYIAVGGDIKYNDNSSDKGFYGLIDLKTKETQLYRTGQRISRVKIHDADIPQYIFAVSNSGEFLRLKLSDGIKKARKDIPPERIAYTQLLDIKQCGGDIYIATLDGSIFKLRLKQIDDDPIRKDDMLVITEVVSGFRMCGISMRTAFVHEDYVNIEQKITRSNPLSTFFPSNQRMVYVLGLSYRMLPPCKAMTSPDPIRIGNYRGFDLELSFDSFSKVYVLTLVGQLRYNVELGTDPIGNITRIENVIDGFGKSLEACREQLATVQSQLEAAKVEVQKPFAQEDELAQKLARLAELNAHLNLDEKESVLLDSDPDEGEDKAAPEKSSGAR